MSPFTFSLALIGVYVVLTYGLSIVGMRKTSSLRSFAVGKGDMSPVLVGITMAASIASTATFVINPGFVYTDGLSAYAHYGVGAMAGLICALLVLSRGFQKFGNQVKAYTLPDWIKKRYDSRGLGLTFAGMTLLYVTFIVLILAGSALIVQEQFGLNYHVALVVLLLFVFGYVLMGGSYAHAYTNAFQGGMMLIIATAVFFSGSEYLGAFSSNLDAVSPAYGAWFNADSALYNDFFSVFGSSFVITFALMLQPHILTKLLYLKDDKKDLNRFLVVTIVASLVFSLMLFAGFWARLGGLEIARQDAVVVGYIATAFHPLVVSFIFVSLLAAGMSTLDGILVSISTVVVTDLVFAFGEQTEARMKKGLALSRYVLVAVGLLSLALAWDPPKLLGLFAQQGVYALVAASAAPLLIGILRPRFARPVVIGALVAVAVAVHALAQLAFGVENPAVSAGLGVLVSVGLGFLATVALSPSEDVPVASLPTP